MSVLWDVSISSYAGLVPGASHYMARLQCPKLVRPNKPDVRVEIDVCWQIDRNTAALWTKCDPSFTWDEGETASRFMAEELAQDAAVRIFHELAPGGDALAKGSYSRHNPAPPLAGPEKWMERASSISYELELLHAQKLSPSWKELKPLYDEWEALLEEFNLTDEMPYQTIYPAPPDQKHLVRQNWDATVRSDGTVDLDDRDY